MKIRNNAKVHRNETPLALPSLQQVLVEQATGMTLTVKQAEEVNRNDRHLLRMLERMDSNSGTLFVPQLHVVGGLNTGAQKQPKADQIEAIISECLPDIEQPIIKRYLDNLNTFIPDQKRCLITMLFQVIEAYVETKDETIRTLLTSVVTKSVCFTGQQNALKQVLESKQMTSKTNATFERELNKMIISEIKKLEQDILNDINARIFYNAPDPQSSHQIEPVRVWLDKHLGLYGGCYPEDAYNRISPAVNEWIAKSFERVGGHSRLTLDFWVKTISDEIKKNPDQSIMLRDYLNQIVTKPALSQHFSPSFISELRDELNERAQKVDTLLFEKDDFELILETDVKLGNVFYPSERLIRELLSVNLKQMNRGGLSEPTLVNPQTEGVDSFCLRNGIKESVIKAAHQTREAVITTIKHLPARWSEEEIALFFHVIFQKYSDITNGMQFSNEEKTQLTNRLNEQNENGETIVFIAARSGHVNAIRVLKELGAKVDTPDHNGATPVYIAALSGHVDAIRVLADLGADVNTARKDGAIPVVIAAFNGHADAIRVLKELGAEVDTSRTDGVTLVHIAARSGHVDAIRVLADLGAKVDTPNHNGATPVYIAARSGHVDAIRVLADLGADVNTARKDGTTPVFIAAQEGHVDAIRVLKELGAKVYTPKNDGATPMYIAAQESHVNVIRVLADLGADVNTARKDGATPVHIAAQKGHVNVIRVLADLGADVNTPINDGATPVHIAAQKGHVNVIRVLADKGADVNTSREDGATPVFIAAYNGHADVIQVLNELGADVNFQLDNEWRL